MWGMITSAFSVLYLLMCAYIGVRGWTAYAKTAPAAGKVIFWCVYALLVVLFPLSNARGGLPQRLLGVSRENLGGYSMVAIVYICLMILCIDLVRLVNRRVNLIPENIANHASAPLILISSVVVLAVSVVALGVYNANNAVVKQYEVRVNKKAAALDQLNIAMVSDIHYGGSTNDERMAELISKTNSLEPDLIMLAGDIVDGNLAPGEAQRLADAMRGLKSRYGVFAVPGNHDRVLRDGNSELSRRFRDAGIEVLRDASVKVADAFYIIGRNDRGWSGEGNRKPLSALLTGIDDSLPVLLMDHQPVDLENAQKARVDLQVAGHTHRGQVFPANLVTASMFELDYGVLNRNGYNVVVSSGFGTWGPALRIGSRSEIVKITVKLSR